MAKTMDRRKFLTLAAGSVAVGALIVLQGCSSDSDSPTEPTPDPTPTYSDKSGVIEANHGHTVTLTAAQQQAGEAVTLTLTTGLGHTHTVSFNAESVADIAAGTRRDGTTSVTDGHSHSVAFF